MLNFLYNQNFKNINFINRKFELKGDRILLTGGINSGKTSIILNEFKNYKDDEKLYIDLLDLRISKEILLKEIKSFILNKNIKILAIENINSQDLLNKILDILKNINVKLILSSKLISIENIKFKKLHLNYLDFEEFIVFFKKNLDSNSLFSQFLQRGASPINTILNQNEILKNYQQSLKANLNENKIKILKELSKITSLNLNTNEIYKNLKQENKISKDSVYKGINDLIDESYISLISNLDNKKGYKKFFFNDFGLFYALNIKKDLTFLFSNMIFNELLKLKEEIFYSKNFDFVLLKRKTAIIICPFIPYEMIFLKFKKLLENLKNLNINKILAISISEQNELNLDSINCQILPFHIWSLGL